MGKDRTRLPPAYRLEHLPYKELKVLPSREEAILIAKKFTPDNAIRMAQSSSRPMMAEYPATFHLRKRLRRAAITLIEQGHAFPMEEETDGDVLSGEPEGDQESS